MKISELAKNKDLINKLKQMDQNEDDINIAFANYDFPSIYMTTSYQINGTNVNFSIFELLYLISRYEETGIDFDLNEIKLNRWTYVNDRVPETGEIKLIYFKTPQSSDSAAALYSTVGYIPTEYTSKNSFGVETRLKYWTIYHENSEENLKNAKRGLTVKFNWKYPNQESIDNDEFEFLPASISAFKNIKDWFVYNLFCKCINTRDSILQTHEHKPMFFFEANDNTRVKRLNKIYKTLNGIELLASTIESNIKYLENLLKTNGNITKYKQQLKLFKTEFKNIIEHDINPFAEFELSFSDVNIFDLMIPIENILQFEKSTVTYVKPIDYAIIRDRAFGGIHNNEILKKIYFDFYDLVFDDIVDFEFKVSSCGNGWKSLIHKAFEAFKQKEYESYCWWERINISQIKEKFGTLRIYFDCPVKWFFDEMLNEDQEKIASKELGDIICALEDESASVCEECGKAKEEDPTIEPNAHGQYWVKTLCQECWKEREKNIK